MMLYVFDCWNVSTPAGRGAQREPLSDRLVRREPADADAHHPRHPHQQDPVPAEPAVLAADGDDRRSSWPIGIAIPFSPLGRYLGFTALPPLYWPLLAATLLCYVVLTQGVKMLLLRRKWI